MIRALRTLFARPSTLAGRRGSVAMLTALMAFPLIGFVGLGVDYGSWNQAYAMLTSAANEAAMNAAKTASSSFLAGNANYEADGVTSGTQWFEAAVAGHTYSANLGTITPTVVVTSAGGLITATVTYSSTMTSIFGKLFNVVSYGLSATASATVGSAPYLEVVMMLDNSSSMSIGATNADIAKMSADSPCDPTNEWTTTNGSSYTSIVNTPYFDYQCSYGGSVYDGVTPCPVAPPTTTGAANNPGATYNTIGAFTLNFDPNHQTKCPNKNGYTAYAGAPCAFACHFDGTKAAGIGNDLYATARHNNVTIRFDLLKNAAQQLLTAMVADNLPINNLSVGIYTFNGPSDCLPSQPNVTNVYPGKGNGEAGKSFSDASTAVGFPPVWGSGLYTETGIQPIVACTTGNNNNTNFPEAMNDLYKIVTPAGDGTTAAGPRKVLFLVTDGMDDEYASGFRGAMPSSSCQQFKDMGYNVYIVYTPYYPVMHLWYMMYGIPIVEGTGSTSIQYQLQACSSATGAGNLSTYYVSAADQTSLSNALKTFLVQAMNSPLKFVQ